MPLGACLCTMSPSIVKLFLSLGRKSNLTKPEVDLRERGTTTFICDLMKLMAAVHWAAVAVQLAAGMEVPVGSVSKGLVMRLRAWEFQLTISKLPKTKKRSGAMGAPRLRPACWRLPVGLKPLPKGSGATMEWRM